MSEWINQIVEKCSAVFNKTNHLLNWSLISRGLSFSVASIQQLFEVIPNQSTVLHTTARTNLGQMSNKFYFESQVFGMSTLYSTLVLLESKTSYLSRVVLK